jgi:hypothetical protein
MTITLFNNKKGLLHGSDPKRVSCEADGVLRIGTTDIEVSKEKNILPMLFYGATGIYPATFTTKGGEVYELEKVTVKGGWVQPPPPTTVELMELRYRTDKAEEKIAALEGIFDTNALNFII